MIVVNKKAIKVMRATLTSHQQRKINNSLNLQSKHWVLHHMINNKSSYPMLYTNGSELQRDSLLKFKQIVVKN